MSLPISGASSRISTSTPTFWLDSTKSLRAFLKNSTISWRTAPTSSRFSKRSPLVSMTQRSWPRIRLPAIHSTFLNKRTICHFLSSLQHSCLSSSRCPMVLFPCTFFFFAPALALACKAGCWIHQRPQGSSKRLHSQAISQFSHVTLLSRIHSPHVVLDPISILFLCPLTSPSSVVRVLLSSVRSRLSLTVHYSISIKQCLCVLMSLGPWAAPSALTIPGLRLV